MSKEFEKFIRMKTGVEGTRLSLSEEVTYLLFSLGSALTNLIYCDSVPLIQLSALLALPIGNDLSYSESQLKITSIQSHREVV